MKRKNYYICKKGKGGGHLKRTKLLSKVSALLALAVVLGIVHLTSVDASAAAKVKSVKVTPSNKVLGKSKTLYVGGPKSLKTTKLKVVVKPAKASKKVKYQSSNKKVATVSKTGKVTAKKAGKATITVTSKSNKKAKKKVKIKVKKYVSPKMTVKATKATIYNGSGEGKTSQVTANFSGTLPSKQVTYTSSDKTLATVSSKGVVTANSGTKTGTVVITVQTAKKTYAKKTLKQTVTIKVANRPAATAVKLNATTKSLTKTGKNATPKTTLTATVSPANADARLTWSSSDSDVATVNSKGEVTAVATGKAVITVKTTNGKTASCTVTVRKSTVPVHDPSIFRDPNSNKYYTIGTGVAMAVSEDLQSWSNTTSGAALFKKGIDELQPLFDYTQNKDMASVWAADLIYNTDMQKYCMYTCAAAGNWKTVIGMFSSDKVTGPYEFKGIIVCADFNKTTLNTTNIVSALGLSSVDEVPARYYDAAETGNSGSAYYRANFPDGIDPAPFYGHDGNLYLTYGSFTCYGGIRVLKLNPKTGLRDTNYNYEYVNGESDPYFGKQITNKAGEGPYILKVPCDKSLTGYYYYLWTSSGILRGSGNYTMSMWRSENPDGPFVDASGTDARSGGGNVMVYNYKYSFMQYAHTSMGGNSALVDKDGKVYLVYHNKFSDNTPNPGSHMVKVHQMFINADGWLVMAPFEYHGETLDKNYSEADVVGNYEFVMHRQATASYVGDYNYNISIPLRLYADKTLTISGVQRGTWELSGKNITLTIDDVAYKGVVFEQYEEDGTNGTVSSHDKTLVFTALGSNRVNITGTKVTMTDTEAVTLDKNNITVPEKSETDFTLPVVGIGGSDITWASNNTTAIAVEGRQMTVKRLDADTTVTLTATIKRGTKTDTKAFQILIPAYEIVLPTTIIESTVLDLPTISIQGNPITWTSSREDIINPMTGVVTKPNTLVTVTLTATYGTVTRTFEIRVGELTLTSIYSKDYESGTTADAGWAQHGGLTAEVGANAGNHYAKFTSTGSGPRSGLQNFAIAKDNLTSTYVIATDFSVTTATYGGSGQPTTQIAFVSQSNTTKADGNALAASECIIDLQATGMSSRDFVINGDEDATVTLAADTWYHMEATIDQQQKQVFLKITDTEGNEVYAGTFAIAGDTAIKGIYTLNGRGGTVTMFDNTAVKVTE